MHELSIALSILDIAAEEAQRHGGARVGAVHLRLGMLSGVVKEALLSAYELASESCGMSGSRLVIEEMPVVIHCSICHDDHVIASIQNFSCPRCGTLSSHVLRGREMEVTAMELIDEPRTSPGPGAAAGDEAE